MNAQDRDTIVCDQTGANSTHNYRHPWIAGQGLIQRDVGRGEGHGDIAGRHGQQRRPADRVIGCQDIRIVGPCPYTPHLG